MRTILHGEGEMVGKEAGKLVRLVPTKQHMSMVLALVLELSLHQLSHQSHSCGRLYMGRLAWM